MKIIIFYNKNYCNIVLLIFFFYFRILAYMGRKMFTKETVHSESPNLSRVSPTFVQESTVKGAENDKEVKMSNSIDKFRTMFNQQEEKRIRNHKKLDCS